MGKEYKVVSIFRTQGGNKTPMDKRGTPLNASREIIQVRPDGFIQHVPGAEKFFLYISNRQHALMFYNRRIRSCIGNTPREEQANKPFTETTHIVQARFPYWFSNLVASHSIPQNLGSKTEPAIVDPGQRGISYGLPAGKWTRLFMASCLDAKILQAGSYEEMKEIVKATITQEEPRAYNFRDPDALYKYLSDIALTDRDLSLLNDFGMNVDKVKSLQPLFVQQKRIYAFPEIGITTPKKPNNNLGGPLGGPYKR